MILWPPCFALVKEDREAVEGIGNPAFNMSSPDLSAYQTSEKKVIRHDLLDHTLAAHQQKRRLLASAELRGVLQSWLSSCSVSLCSQWHLLCSWSNLGILKPASSIPFQGFCTGYLGGSGYNVAGHNENLLCHWCAGCHFTYEGCWTVNPLLSQGAEVEQVQSQDISLWCG